MVIYMNTNSIKNDANAQLGLKDLGNINNNENGKSVDLQYSRGKD